VAISSHLHGIHPQHRIFRSLARWCLMRCLFAAAFVATLILPAVGRAQEPQSSTRDRLFVSAGLGWSVCHCQFHGAQLRAEYSLTPAERVVGLRMDLGVFWTPAQRYSFPSALYDQGASAEGVGQSRCSISASPA